MQPPFQFLCVIVKMIWNTNYSFDFSRFQKCWIEESQRSKPRLLRAINCSLGGRYDWQKSLEAFLPLLLFVYLPNGFLSHLIQLFFPCHFKHCFLRGLCRFWRGGFFKVTSSWPLVFLPFDVHFIFNYLFPCAIGTTATCLHFWKGSFFLIADSLIGDFWIMTLFLPKSLSDAFH